MVKLIAGLILATLMAGCVSEITVTPSRIEERVTRGGNIKLMCPTVGMVYDIVDNDFTSPTCQYREVVAPFPRSYYESYLFGRVSVMQAGVWFWPERGTIRDNRFRYY